MSSISHLILIYFKNVCIIEAFDLVHNIHLVYLLIFDKMANIADDDASKVGDVP